MARMIMVGTILNVILIILTIVFLLPAIAIAWLKWIWLLVDWMDS